MNNVYVNALLVLTVFNIGITALKQILDKVASGSSADSIVGSIAGYAASALSFLSANTQSAPVPPTETPKV